MSTTAQPFDTHMSGWKEMQNSPWGKLRYGIANANINRHLSDRALKILDAGGGNGLDGIALAVQGHSITLVDFSKEMLADARRVAQEHNVSDRMTFHHADLATLPVLFPKPVFDVVLCHNVIQYVEDIEALLKMVCQPLKQDGLFSLISVNSASDTYRKALFEHDFEAALANIDATSMHAFVFDAPLIRRKTEDVIETLQSIGCTLLGRYGIRSVCDYIPDNKPKFDPTFFAQLEQLEHALSDRYPFYLLARYFHLIARKSD